jgi:hypothetical protein
MISARTARIDDNFRRGTDGSNPLRSSGESIANHDYRAHVQPRDASLAMPIFIVPIPGAKSRKHLEENVRAAEIANSILQ